MAAAETEAACGAAAETETAYSQVQAETASLLVFVAK